MRLKARGGVREPAAAHASSGHPEMQHKKPQDQYSLNQECGFLYLISQCTSVAVAAYTRSVQRLPQRHAILWSYRHQDYGPTNTLAVFLWMQWYGPTDERGMVLPGSPVAGEGILGSTSSGA
eukprot:812606-Rhodomonas_salina.1